jgi:uncharacterized protein
VTRFWLLIVPILVSMFLGACANSTNGSIYRLNAEHLVQDMDPGMPIAIVIDYVSIPELVDRPQFVIRVNQSQVRVDEAARWGEPLRIQIASVIAADLGQLFRDALVSTSSQPTDRPTVRLAISVQTFDSTPGVNAVLVVFWSILTPNFEHVLNGKSVVIQQVDRDGYDALVDAHSRALAAVSDDIATAIVSGINKKPGEVGRIFTAKLNSARMAVQLCNLP